MLSRYEYDVPRINFSFFESQPQYQECTPKPKHKTELHIPVEQLREENLEQLQVEQFREEFLEEISHDRTYHSTESEEKPRLITEVKITLTTVQIDVDKGNYVKLSKSYSDLAQARRKSDSNIVTEAVKKKELVTRSLDFSKTGLIMGKSESVPNISCGCEDEQNDEGFYKVPGAARRYRISQSLDDISVENVDRIPSAHSSVEHISCRYVTTKGILLPCHNGFPKCWMN